MPNVSVRSSIWERLRMFLVLLSLLGISWMPHAVMAGFPANYENFDVAVAGSPGNDLPALITQGKTNILLPQGAHIINNPIHISRSTDLVIHGAGRMRTSIIGINPAQPLFIIDNAAMVSFAGIEFRRLQTSGVQPNQSAIVYSNATPVNTEIQDSFFRAGAIEVDGPGRFVVQGSHFDGDHYTDATTHYTVDHGIVVNNAGASVFVVGGNFSNYKVSHIEQQQGHLEVYGAAMQEYTAGPESASIVIRTPSPYTSHAHIIAAVRSEGNTTEVSGGGKFLYVPPTMASVNVLLKDNLLSTVQSFSTCPANVNYSPDIFADYNAAGTLWLIGNQASDYTRSMVAGNSAGTIYSAGNALRGCTSIADDYYKVSGGAQVFHANDLYHHYLNDDVSTGPRYLFTDASNFTSWYTAPLVPQNINSGEIPVIHKPTVTAATPAGFLVNACPNGPAGCDLQASLDSNGANIFIPAGTYNLSTPLTLNQAASAVGGLIAGEGSGKTILKCSSCTSIFQTNGMAYTTLQGITFELDTTLGTVVSLEWPASSRGNGLAATQANNFYDVQVIGGQYGAGIGLVSQEQCSENLFVDSGFSRSSSIGAAIGKDNALSNNFNNVSFSDSPWAVGYPDTGGNGTWGIFKASIHNISTALIRVPGGGRTLYHNKVTGDAAEILHFGWNSNPFSYLFDNSQIVVTLGTSIHADFGQGITFLRSSITNGSYEISGGASNNYIHSIMSDMNTLPPEPLEGPSRFGSLGDLSDDVDLDGIATAADNCPNIANPVQADTDANGVGDACDTIPQTITLTTAPPVDAIYNNSFIVAATASSALAVAITAAGGCSIAGNAVTMTSGSVACTIYFNQPGDSTYRPASQVVSIVNAIKANQTITTNQPSSAPKNTNVSVNASAASGLVVTISKYAGSCNDINIGINNNNASFTARGSGCDLKYTQDGNENYKPATNNQLVVSTKVN